MLPTYKTILSQRSQLNSNTYLYHFDLIEPKEIIFKPGQYIILKVPSDKGPISRLYSIASSNNEKNSFELIVGLIPGGLASNYLFSLKEKTKVIFQGPAGLFGLRDNNHAKTFLVTGTGIAPARSMLISKNKFPVSNFQIYWGLKNYKDVYLFEELKKFNIKICLSREENLNMIPETDRKYFQLGHIDTTLETKLDNNEFYLCGGRLIVESLKQFLLVKNIPLENIIFEKF
ncbi:MAG: FAD-binding oxidoreductase [Patescibacteria group bacterium]